jgi:hypothetical protein
VQHAVARRLVHVDTAHAAEAVSSAAGAQQAGAPAPEELDAGAVHDVVLRVHLQRVMPMEGADDGGSAAASQCTSVSSFQLSHSVVAPLSIMNLSRA